MVIRVQTTSNIQQWLRRWERRTDKFKERITSRPGQLGQAGKELGKQLAPRDTQALINSITFKVLDKSKTRASAAIWVMPMTNPKGGRWNTQQYSRYHHLVGGTGPLPKLPGQRKASTGDFHWMFKVREELARRYKNYVRDDVSLLTR